jgi:glycosyltransferase involved in cell wall biosynthesis
VWGSDRDRLIDAADLVILPSYSENFGLVVAEALARGVPVLATTGTPWRSLTESGSGWWVPTGVEGLAEGLAQACQLDRPHLDAMGHRGWIFARNTLNWSVSACALADVYRWLAGRAATPDCVDC